MLSASLLTFFLCSINSAGFRSRSDVRRAYLFSKGFLTNSLNAIIEIIASKYQLSRQFIEIISVFPFGIVVRGIAFVHNDRKNGHDNNVLYLVTNRD